MRGHHAFLLRVHLGHIHHLSGAIEALDAEVEKVIAPWRCRRASGRPRRCEWGPPHPGELMDPICAMCRGSGRISCHSPGLASS